jgi:hypothetical protein
MLSHMLPFLLVIGCTGSEPVSEEIAVEQFLKDATEAQLPCSQLEEGKLVPKNIQLGACKDGTTMHITLHRECPSGKYIHNNAVGWWSDDNTFHKGEAPLEITAGCNWK